jgi:flagellar secretion chaperone FliS
MDPRAAADVYRQSSIENAPPIKIVRLLYEGALRFLAQASRLEPTDPSSNFMDMVGRADAIISELRLAIDHSVEAPEITEGLERLYLFCEDELGRAGYERTAEPIGPVVKVLETLLDAWRHVELESQAA